MKALVVFESMFGNTQTIAEAVADGISSHMSVDVIEVGAAPTVVGSEVELLVVGGPTHAFGMSRPGSRKQAAGDAPQELVSSGIGLREWLDSLRKGDEDFAGAAFDTALKRFRFLGTAGGAAEKRLRRLGLRVLAPTQSFYVAGTPGPLLNGEVERAQQWGETLGSDFIAGRNRAAS